MPTTLPHKRQADKKRALARTVFDVLFNGAMLVSALLLAFVVLVRAELSAFGRQESPAPAVQQGPLDPTD